MVLVTEFFDGKAFNTTIIPSTRDHTIRMVNLLQRTLLLVDLKNSLIVLTDLSIVPTCFSLPQMCSKAGCKKSLNISLSNSLSSCQLQMLKDLQAYLLMTISRTIMIVFKDLEFQYWAVRKLILSVFVCKNISPLMKKEYTYKAICR